MKRIGLFLAAFVAFYAQGQTDLFSPNSQFAMGSSLVDLGHAIAYNNDGDMYVFGQYDDEMDIDISEEELILDPLGLPDLFLAKFNTNGEVQWGFTLGRIAMDDGMTIGDLQMDNDGNIYISGGFSSFVDFDPSEGDGTLTSQGGKDAFLIKYNADGEYQWGQSIGTSGSEIGTDLSIDNDGNILYSLRFTQEFELDVNGEATTFTPVDLQDALILKLDENGDAIWSHQIGTAGVDIVTAMTVGPNGELVIGAGVDGVSSGIVDYNMLLSVLDAAGDLIWEHNFENLEQNEIRVIRFSASGDHIYIGGRVGGVTDLDPSENEEILNPTFVDPFFGKYALADGAFIFGSYIQSDGIEDYLIDIAEVGPAMLVFGSYDQLARFDPDDFLSQLLSNGDGDAYVASYDKETGAWLDAVNLGGAGNEKVIDGYFDGNGTIYSTGSFTVSVQFDPNEDAMSSNGFSDVFIAKFNYDTTLDLKGVDYAEELNLYPVPASNVLNIVRSNRIKGNIQVRMLNVVGQEVNKFQWSSGVQNMKQDVTSLQSGVYILEFSAGDQVFSKRFVKK